MSQKDKKNGYREKNKKKESLLWKDKKGVVVAEKIKGIVPKNKEMVVAKKKNDCREKNKLSNS